VIARALLLVLVVLGGCGAHSALDEPTVDAGSGGAGGDAGTSERSCPPDCTVGHECLAGGCDGPAVAMPSDCCSCLPGEVSSSTCG
jgi:hypothetical protein